MRKLIRYLKSNFFDYLFVGGIILISDDSFMFGSGADNVATMVKYVFLLCISLYCIFKYKLSQKQLYYIFTVAFLIISSAILSFSFFSGGLIILFLTIIIAIETTNRYSLLNFSRIFVDVIGGLNLYSLIIWLLVSFHIFELQTVENVAGVKLLSSYFCQFFPGSIPGFLRASSIFREPGMYMIFICMSYALEVYILRRNINWFKLIVYIVSILSTFSTAGYIILGILYFISIITSNKKNTISRLIVPGCVLVAAILFIKNNGIAEFVFGKISQGEDSASYLGRVSSIIIPLNMIFDSPLWGCGISDFKELYIHTSQLIYNTSIDPDGMATNTILNLAAIFGLPLCIIILNGIYRFSMISELSYLKKLVLFMCIILLFSNESAPYSIPLYWIVFYGFFPYGNLPTRAKLGNKFEKLRYKHVYLCRK